MARSIGATNTTEVAKSQVSPVFLMEFNFSTVLRFWTGIGPLSWDSKTWTGSGDVIKLSDVSETTRVEAHGAAFQLVATDQTLISLALTEDIQGRVCSLYLGFLDSAGALVADPVGPWDFLMDVFSIDDDPANPTLTLTAESYLAALERDKIRRYTLDDHKIDFPTDKGLEFVPVIQDVEITWGQA